MNAQWNEMLTIKGFFFSILLFQKFGDFFPKVLAIVFQINTKKRNLKCFGHHCVKIHTNICEWRDID
jgi:hypothetical protein